jgi:hypothetical protein
VATLSYAIRIFKPTTRRLSTAGKMQGSRVDDYTGLRRYASDMV